MKGENGGIGIDESGKGDYFGPLVVAAVYVPESRRQELEGKGVRDSKRVSDGKALELGGWIRDSCPFEVVAIGPKRYNSLYPKLRNLNRLLAWGHARALENLLERVPATRALSDQFGDEAYIRNALMLKGRQILLEQRVRAEAEISVAAASLVARSEFLRRLEALSRQFGLALPKGAGANVEDSARAFVRKFGPEALGEVAKLHFRTTGRVLASGRPEST